MKTETETETESLWFPDSLVESARILQMVVAVVWLFCCQSKEAAILSVDGSSHSYFMKLLINEGKWKVFKP